MKRTIATLALVLPVAAVAQTIPTAQERQDSQLSQCLTLSTFAYQVTALRDKGVPMETNLISVVDTAAPDQVKRLFGDVVRVIYLDPLASRASPAQNQLAIFKSCVKATLTY